MSEPGLHPRQLFHIGVVSVDIDAAMAEMSRDLGLSWKGGKPQTISIHLYGQHRRMEMRIAHSVQGPPHFELIEAHPDSPWEAPAANGVHHLCYWAQDPASVCVRLEASGSERVLGEPGSPRGYFRSPGGIYIEIIGTDDRDALTRWIRGDASVR